MICDGAMTICGGASTAMTIGRVSVLKRGPGGHLGAKRRCSATITPKSFTKSAKLLGGVSRTLRRAK